MTIDRSGSGYKVSQVHGAQPFASSDPDSSRIWWSDVGVHQNLTFPVQPDPVSGMHCWHQRVTLEKAGPDDRYGDIFVDTGEVARDLQGVARDDAAGARPRRVCAGRSGSIVRCVLSRTPTRL